MNVEDIAMICYEANRAYCRSIGDNTQLPWEAAPQWQRTSAMNGVRFILSNPDAPPSASHENWLAEKTANGWKYGPVKDEEKREHPCCVPYDQLPREQRVKDYLFGSIVRTLVAL